MRIINIKKEEYLFQSSNNILISLAILETWINSGDAKYSRIYVLQRSKKDLNLLWWDVCSGCVIYFVIFFLTGKCFCECESPLCSHVATFALFHKIFLKPKAALVAIWTKSVSISIVWHFFMYHSIWGLGLFSVMKIIWYKDILCIYNTLFLNYSKCSNSKCKARYVNYDCMIRWSMSSRDLHP